MSCGMRNIDDDISAGLPLIKRIYVYVYVQWYSQLHYVMVGYNLRNSISISLMARSHIECRQFKIILVRFEKNSSD